MSQDFQPIDPAVPTGDVGLVMAGKLNGWRQAILSLFSGTARPAGSTEGTVWRDTTATPWAVKMYGGANDATLFLVDPTTSRVIFPGSLPWASAGGSANAITATFSPAIGAFINGTLVAVRAGSANSVDNPTFSPNGLTAKTIVKHHGIVLANGDIAGAGHELLLRYVAAADKWFLLNPATAAVPAGFINYGMFAASALADAAAFRAMTENKLLTTDAIAAGAALVTLTDAATIAVNMSLFTNAQVTLGGNRTLGNPTNARPGFSGTILVKASGSTRTLALSDNWKKAQEVESFPISVQTTAAVLLTYYVETGSIVWLLNAARRAI